MRLCVAASLLSPLLCANASAGPQEAPRNICSEASPPDEDFSISWSFSLSPIAESSASPPQGTATDPTAKPQDQLEKKTSNDRIFWTLPNFLTIENAANSAPLTAREKFKVTARGVFDPFEFILTGFVAGLNQAADSNPSYGQGMQGYGKRYGTAYGDNLIENFMSAAVLPSLLHQDPRFYQLGHGGFVRRTAHALSRVFVTRSDAGHTQGQLFRTGRRFRSRRNFYLYLSPAQRARHRRRRGRLGHANLLGCCNLRAQGILARSAKALSQNRVALRLLLAHRQSPIEVALQLTRGCNGMVAIQDLANA